MPRARLRARVRRGSPERPAIVSAAGVVIDPAARRATRYGADLQLTRREYALLELLVRKAGTVVQRAEIVDKLWDLPAELGSNVVDVTVRRCD